MVLVLVFFISYAFALHPLKVEKGRIIDALTKQAIRLYGVNLFESHLGWVISQDVGEMEKELSAIARLGFNALRVPLNMSYIEPAPDIFPDDPKYREIMRQHNLKENFPFFLDALVKKAGELGLYVILEFHELPSDPWRYFAGGNEQLRETGKHGGAISWLAKISEENGKIKSVELDWDKAFIYVPKALAWLAKHYKGNPTLAGIEVPWNEPVGGWAEDERLYFKLVQACARAVKVADPERLVFMDVQDWGAGVNFLTPASTWRTPPEVDGLFPHFYFGMHCPDTPYEQALRCAVANWTSWFISWGKPVLIGEYGIAGLTEQWIAKHKKELERLYPSKNGIDDSLLFEDVLRACLEQWMKMGVQGVFYWAWWKGIPGQGGGKANLSISDGFSVIQKFADVFKKTKNISTNANIAVICDLSSRSQYGAPQDLLAISDILVKTGATPFHTIFAQAIIQDESFLRKRNYKKVIVLEARLPEEAKEIIYKTVPANKIFIVKQERTDWHKELSDFLKR